ncbi:hypothetical protein BRC81_05730 [Halobacteriales archaeon QS_1_68_20]|nr:MAG: hypothetical protein BRC81_05730 [Halobacteriales archaeon QS_1_68_20]
MLAGSLAALAGCTQLTPSDDTETDPPEDYSLPDLHIDNERDHAVDVTVRWTPGGESEPTLELAVRVPADEVISWEESSLLNKPGRLTAIADDETGDPRTDEYEWGGDNEGDNRGLVVFVETVGVRIADRVA